MKKNIDVARAWRDEDYFLSLTEEERASLGIHPSGAMVVTDEVLQSIAGGCGPPTIQSCIGSIFCTPCGLSECGV